MVSYWDKGNHEEQSRFLIFYLSKTNAFPLFLRQKYSPKIMETKFTI